MVKKKKPLSLTDEINNKAKEIMKQGDKTSHEAKKLEMINFLDEYYENLSGSSELLVTRKEEISFYATTSKDYYITISSSLISSLIISFLFWGINESEKISSTEAPLTMKIFVSAVLIAMITAVFKFAITSLFQMHNERKKLSDYEKLNVKEYEINLIDKILEQRFKIYKTEIENKNNSIIKEEETNETTI